MYETHRSGRPAGDVVFDFGCLRQKGKCTFQRRGCAGNNFCTCARSGDGIGSGSTLCAGSVHERRSCSVYLCRADSVYLFGTRSGNLFGARFKVKSD